MTDLATIARQNAVECIKVGYRQGKEGHILSLAMNPHDVPDAVATASLGSRWMVALVQISDDEQPQGQDNSGSAPSPSLADAADSPAAAPDSIPSDVLRRLSAECAAAIGGSTEVVSIFGPSDRRGDHSAPQAQARGAAEPATKPKKHWDDYSPSQQAGIVCNDHRFDEWLGGPAPEARWDGETIAAAADFTSAADYVRWYCGVSSRAELDTNPEAAKRWRELHSMFTADTQYGDRR